MAVSFAAAPLSGLFPAVRLSSASSSDLLRQSGAAAPRLRAGRALVLVQVAVSVPLLVGALLFLRTVHNLGQVELGFEPRDVVVFRMDPSLNRYEPPQVRALYERVLDRLQREPGIRSVSLVENSLVSGWISSNRVSVADEEPRGVQINRVGPAFFDTLGMPLVAGRGFGLQDRAGTRMVGVLNEAGAERFFPGQSPLGRTLTMPGATPTVIEV